MANILVVDDELGIRDLLSEILNDEGHNVELAENASAARAARQRERPDLVLLDIWMPDTDGVTLLKEVEKGLMRDEGRRAVASPVQQPVSAVPASNPVAAAVPPILAVLHPAA